MEKINRAVICILQSDPIANQLNTSVKPVVLDGVENTEEHEAPERDLVVIATCLGTLIRQVEEGGYMKSGAAMQAAMDTLNKVYVTNDIKLKLNEDNHTSGHTG